MSDESLSGSGAGAGGEGRALRPQDSVSGQRRTSKGRREGSGGGPWPVPGRHTPWSLSQHPDRGRWNLGSWCGPASGPDTGWLTRGLCSSWALQLVNVGHAGPIPRPRKRALYTLPTGLCRKPLPRAQGGPHLWSLGQAPEFLTLKTPASCFSLMTAGPTRIQGNRALFTSNYRGSPLGTPESGRATGSWGSRGRGCVRAGERTRLGQAGAVGP